MRRAAVGIVAMALAISTTACNQYEMFRVAGFAQESFSNDADILFVVDNSTSMQDEAEELALNFDSFIGRLADPTQGAASADGLHDAVDNYLNFVDNRGRFIDYQLAMTTTDVETDYGALKGDNGIITKGEEDVTGKFIENLFCGAACFDEDDVQSDPSYTCGDEPDGIVSEQYLDCVCDAGNAWDDNCAASGDEEPLEAVLMAMCRATPNPPEECYESPFSQFTEFDELSSEGLMRENSTLIVVLVTDEGDDSRRMASNDDDISTYTDIYDKFPGRQSWAVIGPDTTECNQASATTWGVSRLKKMVKQTNGLYLDIAEKDEAGDCQVADFAENLQTLGDLLNSLLDAFPLQSIPELDSIVVFVDDEEVDEATFLGEDTADTGGAYTDGWSYLPAENAIQFHGDAIPDYNANVRIYYRPLEGMPRELPF